MSARALFFTWLCLAYFGHTDKSFGEWRESRLSLGEKP